MKLRRPRGPAPPRSGSGRPGPGPGAGRRSPRSPGSDLEHAEVERGGIESRPRPQRQGEVVLAVSDGQAIDGGNAERHDQLSEDVLQAERAGEPRLGGVELSVMALADDHARPLL